jgi:hypothetical protein
VEASEHRAALVAQRQGAGEAKGRDRLRAAVPTIDALYERWVDAGRNLGSMTARTLKLLDLYGAELLGAAVEEVLARGMHDPGALAALCEQRRCARANPVPLDVPLPPTPRSRRHPPTWRPTMPSPAAALRALGCGRRRRAARDDRSAHEVPRLRDAVLRDLVALERRSATRGTREAHQTATLGAFCRSTASTGTTRAPSTAPSTRKLLELASQPAASVLFRGRRRRQDQLLLPLWQGRAEHLLAAGDPDALISEVMDCIELIEPKRRDTRERLQAVEDLVRYYRANAHRMKYRLYREDRLPIGSGAVESAHRHVLQTRMKRAGQHWAMRNARRMARLRAAYRTAGALRFYGAIRHAHWDTVTNKARQRAAASTSATLATAPRPRPLWGGSRPLQAEPRTSKRAKANVGRIGDIRPAPLRRQTAIRTPSPPGASVTLSGEGADWSPLRYSPIRHGITLARKRGYCPLAIRAGASRDQL